MFCFFFNDTATTEIYTLSLHDALPICNGPARICVMIGRPLNRVAEKNQLPAKPLFLYLLSHIKSNICYNIRIVSLVLQQQASSCAMISPGSSSSCTGSMEGGGTCAECGDAIIDRFYLFALERRWHNSCLRFV